MKLVRFAWFLVYYNIFVILFGAFVRATGSGAGCGDHWPLCNGEVVPRAEEIQTVIEFTHRLTSGLDLLLVLILMIWVHRSGVSKRCKIASRFAFFFLVVEALIGAGIVLFGLVVDNSSWQRAALIGVHLTNTLLLVASLCCVAEWGKGDSRFLKPGYGRYFLGVSVGFFLISITGAITALGDTLFPAASISHGLGQDFDSASHFLLRLRVLHPIFAFAFGVWMFIGPQRFYPGQSFGRLLMGLIGVQWTLGFLNILLMAPVYLQMVHLLVGCLIWVVFIRFSLNLNLDQNRVAV